MNSELAVKITKTSKLPNDAVKFNLFGNNLDEHFETNGRILSGKLFFYGGHGVCRLFLLNWLVFCFTSSLINSLIPVATSLCHAVLPVPTYSYA